MSVNHRVQLAYCRAQLAYCRADLDEKDATILALVEQRDALLDEKDAIILALVQQRDALEREGAQMRRRIRELYN